MLYRDVLERPSKSQPRTVVAVDIQKAFESVPHAAVIESAGLAGVGGRALNFNRGFLRDRRFKVKIGDKTGPETANHVGVPQRAVLSPTLFNMVMARLPPRLSKIPQLRFALYADDIALWSVAGSVGEQEHALQRGLDEVQRFLEEVGMTASPEKTEFVVVLSGPQREAEKTRNLYTLNLAGKPIKRSSTVRVLGLFIDQDGKAGTWTARVKKEAHDPERTTDESARNREIKEAAPAVVGAADNVCFTDFGSLFSRGDHPRVSVVVQCLRVFGLGCV
ncbi:hypothetical protein ISCGN_018908 [Ixodes scapularis]